MPFRKRHGELQGVASEDTSQQELQEQDKLEDRRARHRSERRQSAKAEDAFRAQSERIYWLLDLLAIAPNGGDVLRALERTPPWYRKPTKRKLTLEKPPREKSLLESLFDLPKELRLSIYEMVLADYFFNIDEFGWLPPLLQTCQQIRREALPVLFRVCEIHISLKLLTWESNLIRWCRWMSLYSSEMLANLRRIEVLLSISRVGFHFSQPGPPQFVDTFSGLATLTMTVDPSGSRMRVSLQHKGIMSRSIVTWFGWRIVESAMESKIPIWNGDVLVLAVGAAVRAGHRMTIHRCSCHKDAMSIHNLEITATAAEQDNHTTVRMSRSSEYTNATRGHEYSNSWSGLRSYKRP